MKKLLLALPAYLFLLLASPSYGDVGPKNLVTVTANPLINTTLAATRSFSLTQLTNSGTYGLLVLYVSVTDANNSVTALGMSCTSSLDGNTTDYTLQDITIAAGVGTSVDASWTKDPSAITSPKRWVWRVDIEGLEDVECTITNTGGTAADTLRVDGAFAVKGS